MTRALFSLSTDRFSHLSSRVGPFPVDGLAVLPRRGEYVRLSEFTTGVDIPLQLYSLEWYVGKATHRKDDHGRHYVEVALFGEE